MSLKTLIYHNNVSAIVEYLKSHNNIPPDDYLTYAITHKYNEIVKILVNSHKVDIEYNDRIALEVAHRCNNIDILKFLKDTFAKPIKKIAVILPFFDPSLFNIYGYTTFSHLRKKIDKKLKHPYEFFIDKRHVDEKSLVAKAFDNVDSVNVRVKLEGELYPPNIMPTRVCKIYKHLSIDEIKSIYYKRDSMKIDFSGVMEKLILDGEDILWMDIGRSEILEIIKMIFLTKSVNIEKLFSMSNLTFTIMLSLFRFSTERSSNFNSEIDKTEIFVKLCEYMSKHHLDLMLIECENRKGLYTEKEKVVLRKHKLLENNIFLDNKEIVDEWKAYAAQSQAQLLLWSSPSVSSEN